MEQTSTWVLVAYWSVQAAILLFTAWIVFLNITGMSAQLLRRVRRAEEAKEVWERAERWGCAVSELPNISWYKDKAPVTAEHVVRWAGMSTPQVMREYLAMWWANRDDLRRKRRARRQALVKEMEKKSKEV